MCFTLLCTTYSTTVYFIKYSTQWVLHVWWLTAFLIMNNETDLPPSCYFWNCWTINCESNLHGLTHPSSTTSCRQLYSKCQCNPSNIPTKACPLSQYLSGATSPSMLKAPSVTIILILPLLLRNLSSRSLMSICLYRSFCALHNLSVQSHWQVH